MNRGLRTREWLLLVYLAITAALAAWRLAEQPANRWVLLSNLLMAAAVLLLARVPLSRAGLVLRNLFPLFLLPGNTLQQNLVHQYAPQTEHPVCRYPSQRHW